MNPVLQEHVYPPPFPTLLQFSVTELQVWDPLVHSFRSNKKSLCISYTIKTQLICIYMFTSTLRLLGRFTTYLAQTTTASRLLFALGSAFYPSGMREKLEIFELFSIPMV